MLWIPRKCQSHDDLPLLMSYLMFSVLKIQNYTLQPYSDLLILSEKLEICRSNKTISVHWIKKFKCFCGVCVNFVCVCIL